MFDGKYLDWNQKRIKEIINFYTVKFFYKKKLLDLGCGHGDVSAAFSRLGSDVTAVDARDEHLKMLNKKFQSIKTVKADLDRGLPFMGKKFDIVVDMGLLCHLTNFESHLRQVCSITNHLILETAVCDSLDDRKVLQVQENSNIYDLSFNGLGSRPTGAMIERVLKECGMNFRRVDSNKFNSGAYVYDWQEKNNSELDINKRRIWFCVKNTSPVQFASVNKLESPKVIFQSHTIQDTRIPVNTVVKPVEQKPQKQELPFVFPNGPQVVTNHAEYLNSLCISGRVEDIKKSYENFEELIKTLNPKIFICTISANPAKTKEVEDLFKPEKITNVTVKNIKPINNVNKSVYSYFLSMQEANKLKETFEQEKSAVFNSTTHAKFSSTLDVDLNKYSDLSRVYIKNLGENQVLFSESMLADICSGLYEHLEEYINKGCQPTIQDLTKYLLNDFSLPYQEI